MWERFYMCMGIFKSLGEGFKSVWECFRGVWERFQTIVGILYKFSGTLLVLYWVCVGTLLMVNDEWECLKSS